MDSLTRRLDALEYTGDADITSDSGYVDVASWLLEKLDSTSVKDLDSLRQTLGVLGCPFKGDNKTADVRVKVLNWLANKAVLLHVKSAVAENKESAETAVMDAEKLHQLAAKLGITPHPSDETRTLKAIVEAVHSVIEKMPAEQKVDLVKDFPVSLGSEASSNELHQAAAILRMLYLSDLKSIQHEATRVLTRLQTYTSSLHLDMKQGRMGV